MTDLQALFQMLDQLAPEELALVRNYLERRQAEHLAFREALRHLDIQWADPSDDHDAALEQQAEEIDRALQGTPLLSEIIIQHRGDK